MPEKGVASVLGSACGGVGGGGGAFSRAEKSAAAAAAAGVAAKATTTAVATATTAKRTFHGPTELDGGLACQADDDDIMRKSRGG